MFCGDSYVPAPIVLWYMNSLRTNTYCTRIRYVIIFLFNILDYIHFYEPKLLLVLTATASRVYENIFMEEVKVVDFHRYFITSLHNFHCTVIYFSLKMNNNILGITIFYI